MQARILRLLSARVGVDFTHYKKSTLHRRIAHRMVLRGVHDEVHYLRLLEKESMEVDALFRDALIHVTSFFRDPAVFQTLQERVLPAIVKHKPLGEPIRFWVPGCSTGEEVYSLAICLLEVLPSDAERPRIQIYATDISEAVIARARAGVYPKSISREVSAARLRRFFSPCPGGYQVAKALREACIFARQNVASDPPFARIDLISCRNLLIYFDAALQKKVLPTLHYALNPGGYLVLGLSEGPNPFQRSLRSGGLEAKNLCDEKHAAAGFDHSTASALRLHPSTEAMRRRRSRRIRQTCASPATGSCSGA